MATLIKVRCKVCKKQLSKVTSKYVSGVLRKHFKASHKKEIQEIQDAHKIYVDLVIKHGYAAYL